MPYECSAERFLENVATHEMTIISDDGQANRILRFKRPGSSTYYFDIATWGQFLVITGDMGTWAFSRTPDMFRFFRDTKNELNINPGYWSEKLTNGVNRDGYEEFSVEKFKQGIKEHFDALVSDDDDKKELWETVEEELLSDIEDEHSAVAAFRDFRNDKIDFCDFHWACNDYKFHFIWCLYAIVWAIGKYDELQLRRAA